MKNVITLCLSFLIIKLGNAQTISPRLIIERSVVDVKNNKIHLICSILNGQNKIVFYKPNSSNDFCLRLNHLTLEDLSSKGEADYFPCHWVADMNRIEISSANSIELKPNCAYVFDLLLNTRKFNNKLKLNHKYEVVLKINHKYICGGEPCDVFTGFLQADKYQITYK